MSLFHVAKLRCGRKRQKNLFNVASTQFDVCINSGAEDSRNILCNRFVEYFHTGIQ